MDIRYPVPDSVILLVSLTVLDTEEAHLYFSWVGI